MSMESKISNNINQNLNPENKRVTVEDIGVFGYKLMAARAAISKSCRQISEGLGELGIEVSKKNIEEWEAGRRFPKEDKLEGIARVYNLEPSETKEAFRISKEARQLEKRART